MPAFGPCRRACGCAGLFFLPPDSAVLSVFVASLFAPSFFPSSVFLLPARISLCPHFPLPVFLSARVSPALSVRPPSSVFRLVFLLSFLVFPFIVHRLPFVVRRPLSIPCCPLPVTCRPLFIARRLLAVARTPYPVPRTPPRLFPLPFGPDHGFCIRGIPACVSAGAACRVVPQRVPSVGLSAKMRPPSVPWSPRRF